jgi:hypothetical protein
LNTHFNGEVMTKRNVKSDFQYEFNNARSGDTLVLDANTDYMAIQDGFVLPYENDPNNPVKIETTLLDSLDPERRVEIANGPQMARLVSPGSYPALRPAPKASGYKLSGIDITTSPGLSNDKYVNMLCNLGRYASGVHDIELDRCWVHSQEDGTDNPHITAKVMIDVEGKNIKLRKCRITTPGALIGNSNTFDNTAGVMMIDGPGPLEIDDCFMSAWFTPFFMGGGNLSTMNTATILPNPTPTMYQATFSNVDNLSEGDLVAIASGPLRTNDPADHGDPTLKELWYEVVKVIKIVDNLVKFVPWRGNIGHSPYAPEDSRGIPLSAPPVVPGGARWNGSNPGNVKITRSQFHINLSVAQWIFDNFARVPKGFFEIKCVDEFLLEGCEFTGWPATFAMTQHNQTGQNGGPNPWAIIRKALIRNFYYHPDKKFGSQLIGLLLEDNVGTSVIGGDVNFENGIFTSGGWLGDFFGGTGVRFKHITCLNDGPWDEGKLLNYSYIPLNDFQLMDSIAFNHEYGMHQGTPDATMPHPKITSNVLITKKTNPYRPNCSNGGYPPGNFCPSSLDEVKMDITTFKLQPDSPYKGKASDGTDPGADFDKIKAAMVNPPFEQAPPTTHTLTVLGGTGSGTFEGGSTLSISATIPEGREFIKWMGAVVTDPNSPTTTIILNQDTTVLALTTEINMPTTNNVALSNNGSSASASSVYDSVRSPSAAINGDRTAKKWAEDPIVGSGWHSKGSVNDHPEWIQINFPSSKTISEVDVFSVQDNYESPVEPTLDLTFSHYGLVDFNIEYWDGSKWSTLATIKGNKNVWVKSTFNQVTTDKIRLWVTKTGDGFARVAELEAYEIAQDQGTTQHFPISLDCEVTLKNGVATGVKLIQK